MTRVAWCGILVWGVAVVALGVEAAGEFAVTTERERLAEEGRLAGLDAGGTGWASEVFHERTQAVLAGLGRALVAGDGGGELVAAGARMVVPGALERVLRSGGVEVLRAGAGGGEVGIGEGLAPLREFLRAGAGEVKFKQYGVVMEGAGGGRTEVLVSARVAGEGWVRSRKEVWEVAWGGGLRVAGVVVKSSEEVRRVGEVLFEDRTEALLGGLACYGNVVDWGANRMSERMVSESGRLLVGISLGDANGDGRDDVFCPQGAGMPNLYLVSVPGGGFEEIGREAGLDWLDRTAAGLWVDFDNDGDQDLAVATTGLLVLMENVAEGRRFARRASFRQEDSSALCAADYDGDGLVDLYIGNYMAEDAQAAVASPEVIYDAQGGGANRLYRNAGGFSFSDVTEAVGLGEGATRMTLAAGWEDFDNDGDADLYVANDFGRNCLYRNDAGRFVEIAEAAGADDPSTGMSVSWGDVDLDGRMDVSVANMFSAAGNRVVPQARFRELVPEVLDVERIGVLARGNALLMNAGGGRFEERGAASGMGNTQWTWGLLLADLDNSRSPDVVAVNGFLTGPDEEDL